MSEGRTWTTDRPGEKDVWLSLNLSTFSVPRTRPPPARTGAKAIVYLRCIKTARCIQGLRPGRRHRLLSSQPLDSTSHLLLFSFRVWNRKCLVFLYLCVACSSCCYFVLPPTYQATISGMSTRGAESDDWVCVCQSARGSAANAQTEATVSWGIEMRGLDLEPKQQHLKTKAVSSRSSEAPLIGAEDAGTSMSNDALVSNGSDPPRVSRRRPIIASLRLPSLERWRSLPL